MRGLQAENEKYKVKDFEKQKISWTEELEAARSLIDQLKVEVFKQNSEVKIAQNEAQIKDLEIQNLKSQLTSSSKIEDSYLKSLEAVKSLQLLVSDLKL